MAFPTTGTIDAFNRTAENPLSDGGLWTIYPTVAALLTDGTECGPSLPNTSNGMYRNNLNYGPDAEAWVIISDPGGQGANTGLLALDVRYDTASDNGYRLDCPRWRQDGVQTDEFRFKEVTGGVETQLGASITQDVIAGDSVGVEMIGTTMTAYYKSGAGAWTALGTRTPSTSYPSAGKIGIHGLQNTDSGTGPTISTFNGGTVVVSVGGIEMTGTFMIS